MILRAFVGVIALFATVTCWGQNEAGVAGNPHIERGRYLVAAGNCVSCHTRAGGQPFAGGVAFDTPLGTIYSTNITTDRDSGIGQWSLHDFERAMHEGIRRDGSRLFPAFPYTSFTKVTDADIADIYAYLRTLKPVRYTPPSNGWAFSMRWQLAVWNKLFFQPGRFVENPSQSVEWNRGAYLVTGLGHCSACHTPRGVLLAELQDRLYTGGVIRDTVAPGRQREWFAVNLTSAKQGLAAWSVTELTKYLHSGVSPRAGTFGPMNEVIVNSLKQLSADDVHAMAVYVKSLSGADYSGESVTSAEAAQGAGIYKDRCEKCHGSSGRGGFFGGPALVGNPVVQGDNPASLINVIIYGPTRAKEISYGAWETMNAYGDLLDDDQVAAICNYLRGSWGNRAAAVTAKDVHAQR